MLRKVSIKVLDLDSVLCIPEYDMNYSKNGSKLKHLRKIMADKKFMKRCNINFMLGQHHVISDTHYTIDEVINIEELNITDRDYFTYMHIGMLLATSFDNSGLIKRLINDIIDEYSFCQSMDVEGIEHDSKINIYLEQGSKGYRYYL